MQRRNVDLPDPDGPMTQATSPGMTVMSMPRSTSTCPKLLWTSIASTMGVVMSSPCLLGGPPRQQPRARGTATRAPPVVALDEALPDREH